MRDCAVVEGGCPGPAAELVWLQAPPQPALHPIEAHVLAIRLDQISDLDHARSLLSRDEKARSRFY
jgi:hypothetical protein